MMSGRHHSSIGRSGFFIKCKVASIKPPHINIMAISIKMMAVVDISFLPLVSVSVSINIGIYLIYKVRLMGWLMEQGASSWLLMLAFDAT